MRPMVEYTLCTGHEPIGWPARHRPCHTTLSAPGSDVHRRAARGELLRWSRPESFDGVCRRCATPLGDGKLSQHAAGRLGSYSVTVTYLEGRAPSPKWSGSYAAGRRARLVSTQRPGAGDPTSRGSS